MDLSQARELAPGRLEEAKPQLAGHGLSVSDLGASAQMHEMDPRKHAAQLAEARRFIDLAQALGAPYVRVFGNNYVKYVPRADMLAHIARGLRELGDYAQPKGVTVLLESHGDFTDSPSLLELLRLAALVLLGVGVAPSAPRLASRVAPPAPLRVYSLRADALARAKRRLASGDSSLRPAYDRLVREAAADLVAGPFSVMDKQRTPPSGDKHDYVSMGPYWWPDSTKPGGLPYVRRDGERNPEIRRDYDASRWGALSSAVGTLALAYYFSDDEKYAERAARLLRVWFLDPGTRMNPNLRYGQRIPGIAEGRGAGIIETRSLVGLVDAIGMLERSPAWTHTAAGGMRSWMSAYLQWLRTSEIGKEER